MSNYSLTFDSDELAAVMKAVAEMRQWYEDEEEFITAFNDSSFKLLPGEQAEYEAFVRAEDKLRIARKV